jgi:multidrug resistance efflux pump
MSDTPRTEGELNRQKCWSDDLVTIDANFACQLERELNAANSIIRQQQLLDEENLRLQDRIKRLEAAGDEAIYPLEYANRVRIWTEAKEAKP